MPLLYGKRQNWISGLMGPMKESFYLFPPGSERLKYNSQDFSLFYRDFISFSAMDAAVKPFGESHYLCHRITDNESFHSII